MRGIIEQSRVIALCTTDDPADSLEWHRRLAADASFKTKVLPAFRPDKALNIDKASFSAYLDTLGQAAGGPISTVQGVKNALLVRMDYFDALGCRASDHGIDGVSHITGRPGRPMRR